MSHGPRWRADILDLLSLAWPVVINRLGVMMLGVVDAVMVGRYAAEHLAYFGLGTVPSNILILILVGLLMGVPVLVAQRFGARDFEACGAVWWQSVPYAIGLGILGMVICAFGEPLLLLFGQTPELARAGGAISIIAGYSLPLLTLYLVTSMFLEGVRKVRPGMIIIVIANIVNVGANYVLIYGAFGFPELGAEGAAWASFNIRLVQLIAILAYVWWMHDAPRFGLRNLPRWSWSAGQKSRQIGYMTSVGMGIEHLAFNALVLFAGLLGTVALAAQLITINVFGLGFMFGLGISVANGVRVGNAHGAGHNETAQRNGWLGLGVQMALLGLIGVVISLNAGLIVSFYTTDFDVQVLGRSMLSYLSLFLLIDGGQTLMAQAMRARGDARTPMLVHLFSYGIIMIPLTYLFCFPLQRGALGLVDSTVVSSFVSLALGAYGFARLGRMKATASQ